MREIISTRNTYVHMYIIRHSAWKVAGYNGYPMWLDQRGYARCHKYLETMRSKLSLSLKISPFRPPPASRYPLYSFVMPIRMFQMKMTVFCKFI